jgi:hypothetical protein
MALAGILGIRSTAKVKLQETVILEGVRGTSEDLAPIPGFNPGQARLSRFLARASATLHFWTGSSQVER